FSSALIHSPDSSPTPICTLSLHDALPIYEVLLSPFATASSHGTEPSGSSVLLYFVGLVFSAFSRGGVVLLGSFVFDNVLTGSALFPGVSNDNYGLFATRRWMQPAKSFFRGYLHVDLILRLSRPNRGWGCQNSLQLVTYFRGHAKVLLERLWQQEHCYSPVSAKSMVICTWSSCIVRNWTAPRIAACCSLDTPGGRAPFALSSVL